jgi:Tfp pilus assembly protein PilN
MRPVNLIPPEQRRGEHAPARTGPLVYILVGALVAVLAGVTMLVLTGNQISERKSDVATLEREDAEAQAKAERLAAYVQFRTMREQRVATVTSLADSRFDWERVMRELALILPGNVWLTSLDASASPETEGGGGGGSGGELRSGVQGPALSISGCAKGHDGVAGFVTALKDIDGVTRVGVESSALPDQASGSGVSSEGGGSSGGGESGGSGSSESCPGRDFIAQFSLVVAFDAAPIPAAGAEVEAPATATETAETTSSESEESEGG